jgi:low affinity Fe/Cu permease
MRLTGEMAPMKKANGFTRFSNQAAHYVGRPVVFLIACVLVVVWAITGPFVGYSDAWQLTINTGTTIITFLMVFLIQNTQNRDAAAVQIKLDELIRATEQAHNSLLNLEELSEEDIENFRQRYIKLASLARRTGIPDLDDMVEEIRNEAADVGKD